MNFHKELKPSDEEFVSLQTFAELSGLPLDILKKELTHFDDSNFMNSEKIKIKYLRTILERYLNDVMSS